jgi:hypothetical protein
MHYALTVERAARRIAHRGWGWIEPLAIAIAGIVLIISMLLQARGVWDLRVNTASGTFDPHIVGLIALVGWMIWYHTRIGRVRRSIIDRMRCFECGAELRAFRTDEGGVGTCPTCGNDYNARWYRPPGQ